MQPDRNQKPRETMVISSAVAHIPPAIPTMKATDPPSTITGTAVPRAPPTSKGPPKAAPPAPPRPTAIQPTSPPDANPRIVEIPKPAVAQPTAPAIHPNPPPPTTAPPRGTPTGTRPHHVPLPESTPPPPTEATAAALALRLAPVARSTLLDALFKDLGEPGSLLDHPNGRSFTLRRDLHEGALHSQHTLMAPLPNGVSVSHVADLVLDIEGGPIVYVDVFDGQSTMKDVKAGAFDAFHLKARNRKHHAICVFVRSPHSVLQQEQVEAVGHSYDYCFGIDDQNATLGLKFAACLMEIQRRIKPGA